jgi:hypothetical protein
MDQNPYKSPDPPRPARAHIAEPIRVSGRLTYDDHRAIGGVYVSIGKWQRRFTWLAVGMVPLLFLLSTIRTLQTHSLFEVLASIPHLIGFTIVAVITAFVGLLWWARRVGKAASDAGEGIYAEHHFVFSEDEIDVRTPNIQLHIKWDGFSSVHQNEDYLVLHLMPKGPASIAIARKWFDNASEWHALVEYANQSVNSP